MSGISSKAAGGIQNRYKFNAASELNNDFDISFYETNFRSLDPQLGRFCQTDPWADATYEHSQYAYANNNPLTFNDPLGLTDQTPGVDAKNKYDNAILPEVVVRGKREVSRDFTRYVNFANGRGYSIASSREGPVNLFDKNYSVFRDWVRGTGAENRVYLPNHYMTKSLKNSYQANLAREAFYKKYLQDYKNGRSLQGGNVSQAGTFGLTGLVLAGTDMVEQFVGGMGIEIHVDEAGENLLFVARNTTGKESAYYHSSLVHDIQRSGITPEGNLNQIYIWKEPINGSGFSDAQNSIDREQTWNSIIDYNSIK